MGMTCGKRLQLRFESWASAVRTKPLYMELPGSRICDPCTEAVLFLLSSLSLYCLNIHAYTQCNTSPPPDNCNVDVMHCRYCGCECCSCYYAKEQSAHTHTCMPHKLCFITQSSSITACLLLWKSSEGLL